MKYSFLLVLILLSAVSASAQSNYKPGYVVTLSGDTVKGFVDYKEWDKNPRKVSFKKDLIGKKEDYSVVNAKAFGVTNFESYTRFAGWISQDKLNIQNENIHAGIDTSKTLDTVFLRVINAAGPLSLYAYKDNKKIRFFIKDGDDGPVELVVHSYYKTDGDQNIISTDHRYRIQLNNLAIKYRHNDVNSINSELQKTGYDETPLNKIVTEINGHADSWQGKSQGRGGSRFFVGIAANNAVISFSKSDIGLTNSKGSSIFPKISVGGDVFINKNVRTVIFRGEISITANHQNINGSATGFDGHNYTDIENMKFDQFVISFNPQMLYNFYNTDNLKVYVAGGVALNYYGYTNQRYHVTFDYGPGASGSTPRDFPDVQSINFSFTTNIGCELNKKIGIFAGVNPSTKLNDNYAYAMYLTSYHVGVNYLFGR